MYKKNILYILTIFFIIFICFGIKNNLYHNINDNNHKSETMIWYQIIPDRWYNAYQYNDYSTWPLDWNNIGSGIYSNGSLQNARISGGSISWYHDRFILSELEKRIVSIYKSTNKNLTNAMSTSSVLRNRRFGGDFLGIEEKLGYLSDLGVDGILIHPIRLSLSPMRYDIIDWRHIDPRLTKEFDNRIMKFDDYLQYSSIVERGLTESDKDFFNLVNKIHIKGLKIIIDMPLLYAGVGNYLIKDVAIYGNKSQYYEWFDFSDKFHRNEKQSCSLSLFYDPKYYPGTELVYYQGWRGDCTKIYIKRGIGKFGIADGLYDYYLAIIQRWVGKKIIDGKGYEGVDGIRIDAFEEYPPNFLSAFLSDIKKIKSDTIIIGEKRSTDIKPISQSQVDTITFYPIRQWIESLILQKGNGLKEGVFSLTKKIELFYNNNSNISEKLVNYISSHDTDRLLSRFIYTNRDLATSYFQSSGTEVLWNLGQFAWDSPWISRADHDAHYIHTAPSSGDIKDLYGAIAFQFLMPGSPIIYYGDEIGMYGADDPDNRQPMRRDIHNAFPRHICKRGNNPLEYCLTTDETEDYNGDKDLIQRYKKLIAMKKKSPSLQEGLLSMNICYILDNHLSCTGRQGNYLLWGFHRKKNNNHIIYLGLLSSFSGNIMLQVDEPNKKRTNIYSDATVFSDKKGYILLNNQDFAHGYIVLENK